MKRLVKYIALINLLIISACSKDFGNYEYTKVNDVSIVDGVLTGDQVRNRIYRVVFDAELKISPTVTGTLSGSDVSQLAFFWYIDGELVSEEQHLVYKANRKFGHLVGELKIVDNSSAISKSYNFFVEVMNSFKHGYYILTQKANQDAAFYTISSVTDMPEVDELNVGTLKDMGKNPIYLGGYRVEDVENYEDYWNILFLGVKDAPYPVQLIDSKEFLPVRLYNSSSYIGTGDFTCSPSQIWSDLESINDYIYMNNRGKLHVLTKGVISEVKLHNDPLAYSIASNGLFRPSSDLSYHYNSTKYSAFYDEKNETVRLLSNQEGRLFSFNKAHDYAIDADLIKGHEFLYGSDYTVGRSTVMFTFLTRKDNVIYCFEFGIDSNSEVASTMREVGSIDVSSQDPISKITFNERRGIYYIAMGKTIYTMRNRAQDGELELEEYISLPSEAKGHISDFSIGKMPDFTYNPNLLLISTFDPSFAGEKKSSIYIYDVDEMELFYSKENCVEEVKGLYVGV